MTSQFLQPYTTTTSQLPTSYQQRQGNHGLSQVSRHFGKPLNVAAQDTWGTVDEDQNRAVQKNKASVKNGRGFFHWNCSETICWQVYMNMKTVKVWDKLNKISAWSCPHHGDTSGMHGPPWRCLFSNLDFHKFHKHDIVVDSSGYGSTKLPEKSSHILTLWFITKKKHIYIYIYSFLIKDIISIHSFVLTTTNSPPSTHLPTQKNTENNLPNLPTYCSKLLILTDRLLSKTGSTYDFSLKPSTHRESREPLNWVTSHLRMFWCQPFCSHAEQKRAIQKSLPTSVGCYDSKWWWCWGCGLYRRTKQDAIWCVFDSLAFGRSNICRM